MLALVLLTAVCITNVKPAKAQLATIIVPDNYPTIADAIGNATMGDTILVRSGTYNEQSLETNNSISLIGEGSASTIVNLHPPSEPVYILGQYVGTGATAINFDANNLMVSGLTFNCYGGSSFNGNHMIIACNTLNNFAENWFNIQGSYNTISNNTANTVVDVQCTYSQVYGNNGTGSIGISGFASYNTVFGNSVEGIGDNTEESYNLYYGNIVSGGGGIFATDNDIVANNTIIDCRQGVNLEQSTNNVVVGNVIESNSGPGVALAGYVEGSLTNPGSNNLIYGNYIADNNVGLLVSTSSQWRGANFTVYDNDFVSNTQQAQIIIPNFANSNFNYLMSLHPQSDDWSLSEQGNYWSDYQLNYPNASQVGSTGIWNTPYYVGGGEQDNYPLMSPFDISSINIQLPSWANITIPSPLSIPSFPPLALFSQTPKSTSPLATTVPATTDSGATVELAISGNITSSQMSNVTITTNPSNTTTTVYFTVTGENGTAGFSNVTIPKSAVPFGTTPTIYIDGKPASNQGFTQDSNNYYVWYTTHFSTHQISIVFITTAFPHSPKAQSSLLQEVIYGVAVAAVIVSIVVVALVLIIKGKRVKLDRHA